MFEQSLVISQGNRVSAESRWTWAGSMALQGCAAALLVAFPLLHPERLVLPATAPRVLLPPRAMKLEEVHVKRVMASSASSAVVAAAVSGSRAITIPTQIPHGFSVGDAPPASVTGFMDGSGTGIPAAVEATGPMTRVEVAAAARVAGPLRVSSGVAAGMLMTPIRPVYPSIARAARVEGVVVVSAVISRDGRIERAHVLSGPAMLAGAALEAVETARYTPYRLNGAATEVETTITVSFRMGS